MTSVPSWIAAIGIVAPPIAGLLGYLLAGRNEEARDKRADAREERARRAALAERLAERRHEFQRDLLLDLQAQMLTLVRSTAKVLMFDQETMREKGKLTQLPPDLDQKNYDAGVSFSRALVRVLDDDLRARLLDYQQHTTATELLSLSIRNLAPDDAIKRLKNALDVLTARYTAANERLGASLRAELAVDAGSLIQRSDEH